MKIVYFLENGVAKKEDLDKKKILNSEGHKVSFSNGSFIKGFEDSCDAVVLSGHFPHIEKWAKSKGISILHEKKPEPEPEKPKRGRKPKSESEKPSI